MRELGEWGEGIPLRIAPRFSGHLSQAQGDADNRVSSDLGAVPDVTAAMVHR
jgi:hypothetical protein